MAHPRADTLLLCAILAAYAALAVSFSVATPILESYDERYHFAFVLSVALDRGLPVQNVSQPGPWGNEGSQPPLYYAAAALLGGWSTRPGFEAQIERNPYAARHLPGEPDFNRNYYLHHRSEDFPYGGNVLAFRIARWLSVAFGATAVLITYRCGRLLLPRHPAVALGAAAFQAFIPSYLYVTGTASNDAAVVALASFALWQSLAVAASATSTTRRAAWLGACVALAVLAKLSALPLLAIGALAIFRASGGAAQWRRVVARLSAFGAAFAAVAGWWFVRNWLLYREWLGTDTMNRIAGLRPYAPSAEQLWTELRLDIERNFWIAFGSGNVHPPDEWLLLPRLLALAGLAGALAALWRARRSLRADPARGNDRWALALCALWMVALLASLGWWLLRVEHLNGRLLYPALTPLALGIAYGIYRWTPARWSARVVGACGAAMFALAAAMLALCLVPAYARPPEVAEARAALLPNPSEIIFGDRIRLRGYELLGRDAAPTAPVQLHLYWQALAPSESNLTVYAHLLDARGDSRGGTDTLPGRGALPTEDWVPGVTYHDRMPLSADPLPDEPVAATVVIGWYETATQKGLAARAPDGRRLNPVAVGRVRVPGAGALTYAPRQSLRADFADRIELLGYDLDGQGITLYWQARAPLEADYSVFVHALDAQGKIVAQGDGPPRGGNYPTSFWLPGETVRDVHAVALPANVVRVEVGWYLPDSGERLKLSGQPGDALSLPVAR